MIMKKKKSLVVILLLIVLIFCSCTPNSPDLSSNNGSNVENSNKLLDASGIQWTNELGTTHQAEISETGYYLVENGFSNYIIVYPRNADENEIKGANELVYFFEKATGIALTMKTDDEVTWNDNATYLSVGETSLLSSANITPDFIELGDSGYIVETTGKSVFMVGGFFGTLYSVYDFLARYFNYEAFSLDEIRLDKNVREKKFLAMKVKEIPDIQYRIAGYGELDTDNTGRLRMRLNNFNDVWIPLGNVMCHNFLEVIPKEKYGIFQCEVTTNHDCYNKKAESDERLLESFTVCKDSDYHPEWFGLDGNQLCLSRDPDGILEIVKKEVFYLLEKYPNLNNLNFTAEDFPTWCTCESCSESFQKYGTDSAVYIKFINKLAVAIKEWVNINAPGRPVRIGMFAYQKTIDAPVKRDANGKYVAIDDEVYLEDNVALFYAPVYANYYYPLNSTVNKVYNDTIAKWQVLADNMYLWSYNAYYQNYMMPCDSFDSIINNPRFAVENNAIYMYDQGYNGATEAPDWCNLKYYLQSKLQWNCQLDAEHLINAWFEHYFKDAAKTMRGMFDFYRTYYAYIMKKYDLTISEPASSTLESASTWPYATLQMFLNYIDKAYADIELLKATDNETWQLLHDRINIESTNYRYLLARFHRSSFTDLEYTLFVNSLLNDCKMLGMNYTHTFVIEGLL